MCRCLTSLGGLHEPQDHASVDDLDDLDHCACQVMSYSDIIEVISDCRHRCPPSEWCSNCGGHGITMGGEDVVDCYACGGGGWVEKRDARGRFLPWVAIDGSLRDVLALLVVHS